MARHSFTKCGSTVHAVSCHLTRLHVRVIFFENLVLTVFRIFKYYYILFFYRGIPAIVDLAAIRDAVDMFDGDSSLVRPSCPVDLALDSSLQVDISRKFVLFMKF